MRFISNGMKKIFSLGLFMFVVISVFVPHITSARTLFYIWEGTTCASGNQGPSEPCGLCDALVVGRNIIEDMFKVSLIIATVFIIYGGFTLMTAGGSEKRVSSAKEIIKNAVIGLLVALTAWLIINTIFGSLITGSATAPWNVVECGVGSVSGPRETIGGEGTDVKTGGGTTGESGFTGGGGQFGGAGANGSWETSTSSKNTNNGLSASEINKVLTSSCKNQAEVCIKESKGGTNENPQLNINLEAAYQISCTKAGSGYNAKVQFRCLAPVVSPWRKCADGLPDLTKICK